MYNRYNPYNEGCNLLIKSLEYNKTIRKFIIEGNNISKRNKYIIRSLVNRNEELKPLLQLFYMIVHCKDKTLCRLVIHKILDWRYKIDKSI
jgi:Ser-tRNA(Ala) deacylase AlaX